MSNYGYPSRERRDTQPRGRVCTADGCDTVLSRYNATDRCALHVEAEPRSQRATPIYRMGKRPPGSGSSS
jgi:hypothetical protein